MSGVPLSAVISNNAVNVCVQGFCVDPCFYFIPRSRIAESSDNFCLTFWGIARLFSSVAGSFYILTSSI